MIKRHCLEGGFPFPLFTQFVAVNHLAQITNFSLSPDHKDQVDLGEGWLVPVLCRNRAAQRYGGATESCLVCQEKLCLASSNYDGISFSTHSYLIQHPAIEIQIQQRVMFSKNLLREGSHTCCFKVLTLPKLATFALFQICIQYLQQNGSNILTTRSDT